MPAGKMSTSLRAFGIRALLCALLVNNLGSQAQASEQTEPQNPAAVPSEELRSFYNALAMIESDQGAYAAALPEQLYGLGLALQQSNQHAEAITAFNRGVHLTRINQGLYSLEQIPFIQGVISSDLAIGNLDEADQQNAYLLTVQQHSLPSGAALIEALMQQGNWQKKAYELGIGGDKDTFSRLQAMWNLYSTAINDIATRENPTSHELLPPLMGLLKTQYMISTHYAAVREQSRQQAQFGIETPQSYKMGASIIHAIHDIELDRHGEHSIPVVKTLVMLGDWRLWNRKHDSAHQAYVDALQQLSKRDDAEIQKEKIFGEPVPLPDIDGIHWLPATTKPAEGKVLLEFGVNKRGRVFNMTRMDDSESNKKKVERLMKKISNRQFRSRYEGTEPAETEKILWAYDIQ